MLKRYIDTSILVPIRFNTTKNIPRIEQKKLAKVHALEVEYCLNPKKDTIQITNNITGQNNPAVALIPMYFDSSNNPEVSFPVGAT